MKVIARKVSIFIICVNLILVTCLTGCAQKVTGEEAAPPTAQIKRGTIGEMVQFVGNVEPFQTIEKKWQVSGVVETVYVSEGDSVTAGQLLAALSRASLPENVIKAEKTKNVAEEALDKLLVSETEKAKAFKDLRDKAVALQKAERYLEGLDYPVASKDQIRVSETAMKEAKAAYEIAMKDYQSVILRGYLDQEKRDKFQKLQTTLKTYAQKNNAYIAISGDPSENLREKAAAAIKVAEADYQKALEVFKTYQASFVRPVDQAKLEDQLNQAMKLYNARYLYADIEGVVSSIQFQPDSVVQSGSFALRIDNTSTFDVAVNVSELDRQKIKDGMRAEILVDANPGKRYQGVVKSIADQGTVNASDVTFKTIVQFVDADEALKIGMTAQVSIVTAEKADVLLVPRNAVYSKNDKLYVDVLKDGTYLPVAVVTGTTDKISAELISDDVKEGDVVRLR